MKLERTTLCRAALALLCLHAWPASALDLVAAYRHALQHDPAKLAADEALAVGREKALQGDALLRPQVALQAGVSHMDDRSSAKLPAALATSLPSDSSGSVYKATLQLTQPLYDAGKRADRQQLHELSALAQTQSDQSRQELAQRVAEAYFGVLLAEETLRVVEAEMRAIGQQRDRAQARSDVGRGRLTDLQEAQARYDQVLSSRISARSTLALRRAQFQEVVGLPADGLAPLVGRLVPLPLQPDSVAAWQAQAESQSMLVRTRRSELDIADADTGRHRLAGRPTLNLLASYSAGGQSGGLSPLIASDNHRNATLGLQLNVPLYAGGALDSRERESLARRRQAELELAAARRDVRLQVQDAYLAITTQLSRIGSFEQSLLSARTALEATTLGRDVGTRTELDVLDAQQRAFAAELDLAQARFGYLLARVRLASAVGALGESDLHLLNGWLTTP